MLARLELNEHFGKPCTSNSGSRSRRLVRRRECAAPVRLRVVMKHAPRQLEPAFLLHHYPWRDTSRILELLTRAHGRVVCFARRAAPNSGSRARCSRSPMLVSWSRRGEVGQLTGVEVTARPPALAARPAHERLLRQRAAAQAVAAERSAPGRCSTPMRRCWPPARRCRRPCAARFSRSACSTNSATDSTSSTRLDRPTPRAAARLPLRPRQRRRARRWSGRGTLIFCGASLLAGARDARRPAQPAPTRGGCCVPRSIRSWTGGTAHARSDARCCAAHAAGPWRLRMRNASISASTSITSRRCARRARAYPDPVLRRADRRAVRRRQHHAAPARGSPAHPGSRRAPLRAALQTRMNLEMAATDEMVAHRARGAAARTAAWCPRSAQEITTEGGLDVAGQSQR